LSVVKDVDLEAMPTSIFLDDDDDVYSFRQNTWTWRADGHL